MDVVERLILLNNRLCKSIFDVEAITKGLNTYEKSVDNCHHKLDRI